MYTELMFPRTSIENLLCSTVKLQGGYIPEFFSVEDWQPSPILHVSQSSKMVEHTDNLGTVSSHEMRDKKLRTCKQSSHDKQGSIQFQPIDMTHEVLNIAHCSSGGSINEFQQCNSAKMIQKNARCFQINHSDNLLPLSEHGLNAGVAVLEQTQN